MMATTTISSSKVKPCCARRRAARTFTCVCAGRDPRSGGAWGRNDHSAGPPQARSAPSGGSDPRSGGAWGLNDHSAGPPQAQDQPPRGAATRAAAERGGQRSSAGPPQAEVSPLGGQRPAQRRSVGAHIHSQLPMSAFVPSPPGLSVSAQRQHVHFAVHARIEVLVRAVPRVGGQLFNVAAPVGRNRVGGGLVQQSGQTLLARGVALVVQLGRV